MKQALVATFSEDCAPTSIKYAAVSDIIMTIFFQSIHFKLLCFRKI